MSLSGLVDELQAMVHRDRRTPWRFPLLCLVTGGGDPIVELERLLDGDDRQVPHVRLYTASDLPALLDQAHEVLSERRKGLPPLRFPHYELLRRIMEIRLPVTTPAKLERVLASRLVFNPDTWMERNPWSARLPDWLQRIFGIAGMVFAGFPLAVWWPQQRRRKAWLMRQPFARPQRSGRFTAFAVRLTLGRIDREDSEQISLLLAHAFLQDLRVAYGRFRGPRRTAYPVLLLDGATAGHEFLSAVDHIRNLPCDDPLIVVARSYGAGPAVSLATWRQDIEKYRADRKPKAWHLTVDLPAGPPLPAGAAIRPPAPSRMTSPWAAAAAVVALTGGTAAIAVPILRDHFQAADANCAASTDDLTQVEFRGGECVGITGSAAAAFGSGPVVQKLQQNIFAENVTARQRSAIRTDRPIITIVYLTSITRADADRDGQETFVAEREGLRGMWYAQRRANEEAESSPTSPYVQVLIANAGNEGGHTAEVVGMIRQRAADDRRIVAVVASVDSRTDPVKALHDLDDDGLPVITPSMTADGIDRGASLFVQISAPTTAEATLIHHYTTKVLGLGNVINYYTFGSRGRDAEGSDLYVNALRAALEKAFTSGHYVGRFWSSGNRLDAACRSDAVIHFGGRYSQLADFLRQLHNDCSGRLPAVVADGSAARYMANPGERANAPTNMSLAFLSGGYLGTCEVIKEGPLPPAARHAVRQYYLSDVSADCGKEPAAQAAGWSAQTYDAARMLIRAMQDSARLFTSGGRQAWDPSRVQPPTLYAKIRERGPDNPYEGVTGPIHFGADGGVAEGRYLALLCAPSIQSAYRTPADLPWLADAQGNAYPNDPKPRSRPCKAA